MKKILIILLSLISILLVLVWLNSRQQTNHEGILQITAPDGKVINLQTLPQKELQTITTSKGEMQAVAVSALLTKHLNSDNWQHIIFHSSDGAQVKIKRTELPLLYLSQITKNQESYLRLIIPSDSFSQRWLKKINHIALQ
jgi:glycerophosphoryl diester phosphodiesterase